MCEIVRDLQTPRMWSSDQRGCTEIMSSADVSHAFICSQPAIEKFFSLPVLSCLHTWLTITYKTPWLDSILFAVSFDMPRKTCLRGWPIDSLICSVWGFKLHISSPHSVVHCHSWMDQECLQLLLSKTKYTQFPLPQHFLDYVQQYGMWRTVKC